MYVCKECVILTPGDQRWSLEVQENKTPCSKITILSMSLATCTLKEALVTKMKKKKKKNIKKNENNS